MVGSADSSRGGGCSWFGCRAIQATGRQKASESIWALFIVLSLIYRGTKCTLKIGGKEAFLMTFLRY